MAPRGGRSRVVASVGGVDVRKAPLGPLVSLEVQFALSTVQLILLADVLPHPDLVQAHRADDTVRAGSGRSAAATFHRRLSGGTSVLMTTWYLHSHLTWDRLCQSCIGCSFLPRRAFRKDSLRRLARACTPDRSKLIGSHGQRPWF